MFQRGSSPIRLSQLDVTPMVQAAQMTEAANVNLNNAINQSILSFAQKQDQKKQDKIGIQAIQNMFGLDETTAKAMYKDDVVRDAFVMKQKADADLVRKQREQVELEILQGEQQRVQEQRNIFEKAIAVNTTPEGTVDMSGVRQSFADLGGRDESVFGDLFNVRGEIKVSDKGVISQDTPDGPKFLGQISSKFLNKEGGDDADDGNGDPFAGTEDPIIIQFMSANPQFKTYEEAEKHLKEQGLI
jgi:hypothetical protein